jgi:hypothetical protein
MVSFHRIDGFQWGFNWIPAGTVANRTEYRTVWHHHPVVGARNGTSSYRACEREYCKRREQARSMKTGSGSGPSKKMQADQITKRSLITLVINTFNHVHSFKLDQTQGWRQVKEQHHKIESQIEMMEAQLLHASKYAVVDDNSYLDKVKGKVARFKMHWSKQWLSIENEHTRKSTKQPKSNATGASL